MDQIVTLSTEELRKLCEASEKFKRPATIDWTNQTIKILSEVLTHPTVKLSDGPMQYQDILYRVPFEKGK